MGFWVFLVLEDWGDVGISALLGSDLLDLSGDGLVSSLGVVHLVELGG